MKNRDRYILKRNEYDMLCDIQLGLLHGECCVLDALSAKVHVCPLNEDDDDPYKRCCKCLQSWLNGDENECL